MSDREYMAGMKQYTKALKRFRENQNRQRILLGQEPIPLDPEETDWNLVEIRLRMKNAKSRIEALDRKRAAAAATARLESEMAALEKSHRGMMSATKTADLVKAAGPRCPVCASKLKATRDSMAAPGLLIAGLTIWMPPPICVFGVGLGMAIAASGRTRYRCSVCTWNGTKLPGN